MTFWATCVVESMVATHLRNPVIGTASVASGRWGKALTGESSICCRRDEFSNQKRQVICRCQWGLGGHLEKELTSAAS